MLLEAVVVPAPVAVVTPSVVEEDVVVAALVEVEVEAY